MRECRSLVICCTFYSARAEAVEALSLRGREALQATALDLLQQAIHLFAIDLVKFVSAYRLPAFYVIGVGARTRGNRRRFSLTTKLPRR